MRNFKALRNIIKRTYADRILWVYLVFLFISALVILWAEPSIDNYQDSLWYCFSTATTIGFGDFVVVTAVGRAFSILLSLYSLLLIGMIPAIIVNYYMVIVRAREEEAVDTFLNKLENLPDLTKEELVDLSNKIKKLKSKIKN